jgi:DnaJ-domain-containing protein 1
MADLRVGMVDAALVEQQRKEKTRAETIAWAQQNFSPKAFKKWKASYDDMNAFIDRPRKPLRPDLQAGLDALRAKIRAPYEPRLAKEYTLLGIEPGATKRDIKNAYRRMARKLHPDKGGDPEAFKAMYAAYRKLLIVVKE